MKWDDWRGGSNEPAMWIKRLFHFRGYRIDLHKFVRADDEGCFHTHPATAIRLILWGGYLEETGDGKLIERRPFYLGIIRPEFEHRIAALRNGYVSYSLWFRAPVSADIKVRGC